MLVGRQSYAVSVVVQGNNAAGSRVDPVVALVVRCHAIRAGDSKNPPQLDAQTGVAVDAIALDMNPVCCLQGCKVGDVLSQAGIEAGIEIGEVSDPNAGAAIVGDGVGLHWVCAADLNV